MGSTFSIVQLGRSAKPYMIVGGLKIPLVFCSINWRPGVGCVWGSTAVCKFTLAKVRISRHKLEETFH